MATYRSPLPSLTTEDADPDAAAQLEGVQKALGFVPNIDAIRNDTPIPSDRLAALSAFTMAMLETGGRPSEEDMARFRDAGFIDRHVLEVILAVSVKTISNWVNHIFDTPVNEVFESRRWSAPALVRRAGYRPGRAGSGAWPVSSASRSGSSTVIRRYRRLIRSLCSNDFRTRFTRDHDTDGCGHGTRRFRSRHRGHLRRCGDLNPTGSNHGLGTRTGSMRIPAKVGSYSGDSGSRCFHAASSSVGSSATSRSVAVKPDRDAATRRASCAPGTCARAVASCARSWRSNGARSRHFTDPTNATDVAAVASRPPTRSISTPLVRVQNDPT